MDFKRMAKTKPLSPTGQSTEQSTEQFADEPVETLSTPQAEFVIQDIETLRAISDPLRIRLLELMAQPQTVKEIAAQLGVGKTKLYYHLNLLEKHGIIRVARTRVVSGIIEKSYQVAAFSFRPAKELLLRGDEGKAHGVAIVESILDATRADLTHSLNTGQAALGEAVQAMGLRYAVVTSVDRDDLADGGAAIFAGTIREIKARVPDCRVEVLIPDFKGEEAPLRAVLAARPDILNHNTETVPRLYRMARSGGKYSRCLELLERATHIAPDIPTKTGLMVGLGEEQDELVQVFRDLRKAGVAILTLGQYLRPSADHAPMTRYYHPDEFAELKRIALGLGFVHVEAGPLVRSSYHAHEQADAAALAAAAR